MYSRRCVIAGSAAGGAGLLAGCLAEIADQAEEGSGDDGSNSISDVDPTGPEPQLIDTNAEQGFGGALSGTGTVQVVFKNRGDEGDVEVVVTLLDESRTVLNRERETVTVRAGERRRVDMEVSVPDGTERYRAEVNEA